MRLYRGIVILTLLSLSILVEAYLLVLKRLRGWIIFPGQ